MNLLPQSHEEFSHADYWDSFFKKRGKKSFDWYGEYPELSGHMHKYVKLKDDILVVGCGNSTLSMVLYDVGYRNITNIDISQVVIKQMLDMNRTRRPDLIYERMDATEMTYADDKFSVVLDKGTLDALMSDSSEDTISTIDKYFSEITRVLRNGGRYICISLLQEHILKKLVSYFPSAGFMFRVSRCHEAEIQARENDTSSLPVFIVIATKFTKLPQPVLELTLVDGPPERVSSIEHIISAVTAAQHSAFICSALHKGSVADAGEVSLDLYRLGDKNPRYTIHVLDQLLNRSNKSYAAFIVPQERESDWVFSTKQGRQQLLKTAQLDRLATVVLRKEHTFGTWDEIKEEIEESIRNLAPAGLCAKNKIPYLSLDMNDSKRTVCYKGSSNISGPFVVEEFEGDGGHLYRRLVFLNNQFITQSEARLKLSKSRRGKVKKVIDPGFLACEHHVYMSVGVNAVIDLEESNHIAIIGLGGGGLCTFLHQCFPKLFITAVDIDEAMLSVAVEYFGLIQDDRMKVKIMDGIQFLHNSADQDKQFDAILFDVDSKDTTLGMSCPPKEFLEFSVLNTVIKSLSDKGLFILNLVSRNKTLRLEVMNNLKSIFKSITVHTLQNDINEIIMCSMNQSGGKEWKNRIKLAAKSLNTQATVRKLRTENVINVASLLEGLSIEV
ncbi:methyltransferase-like protein 13 [Cephus cinctus]|uniref:Methyltransferase-like protein 13 n=1 Tax=Cephus cinctus TaxID=211228 RepID=A0AAJ7C8R6_CEPCN|nr:methyltransferase-like protein 13 [Cephus cinctus]